MADQAQSGDPAIVRLTRGLAARDESAFREFHTLYFDRLLRYLIVVAGGDESLARDAVQEMFVRVARHAREFADEKAFWDWLAVIGRSAVVDGGRKQSRYRRLLVLFKREPNPPTPPPEQALDTALEAALATLDETDRQLVQLKYSEGCTVREIASDSQDTESAIESRLVRIRRTLRARILKHLGNHE